MSLNQYKIFCKVIELGSLTKAGEELDLTQSAVSHAIAKLEREFGFSLLTRNRGGIQLSQNGARVLRYVEAIMKIDESMKQEVADIHSLDFGTITVGSSRAIAEKWLPGIIAKFTEQYPAIEVQVIEADHNDLEEFIFAGKVDFAFATLPTHAHVESITLIEDRYYLVSKKGIDASSYSSQVAVPNCYSGEEIASFLATKGLVKLEQLKTNNFHIILELVQKNFCQAILPEFFIKDITNDLERVEIPHSLQSIGAVAPSIRNLSAAAEKFIAITSFWLRENYRVFEENKL